ncbi:MAG: 1-deoxy-D-xylulose-5-phosphate reductoisomerase [Firmicutes bacterium]|nr:1-deoxy-D-xylulose-5-phosphate reductoisomerase [Bacillota bacterium]
MRRLVILGSTGSVGTQALDVVRALPDRLRVVGLASAGNNLDLLERQVREFWPAAVAVVDPGKAFELRRRLAGEPVLVFGGEDAMVRLAAWEEADLVLTAVAGSAGLAPTLAAIRANKEIALANKETLVAAGALVTGEAAAHGVKLLPVDSEHSALFQCLQGTQPGSVKKLILTASGGPFRGWTWEQLAKVTPAQALKHPRWNMGRKISIDSATLMNKGLEIIEAHWLFGTPVENIEVVVHPQSTVHSALEFHDGSVLAQLGPTDMRLPIQYALTYPDRPANNFQRLDLIALGSLTFEPPDPGAFPCLNYATEAVTIGGTMPAVVNAANEVAVEAFLDGDLDFLGIPRTIERIMARHDPVPAASLASVLKADAWARALAHELLGR